MSFRQVKQVIAQQYNPIVTLKLFPLTKFTMYHYLLWLMWLSLNDYFWYANDDEEISSNDYLDWNIQTQLSSGTAYTKLIFVTNFGRITFFDR